MGEFRWLTVVSPELRWADSGLQDFRYDDNE
jgi:hypothetical protein